MSTKVNVAREELLPSPRVALYWPLDFDVLEIDLRNTVIKSGYFAVVVHLDDGGGELAAFEIFLLAGRETQKHEATDGGQVCNFLHFVCVIK